jgi:hypothetical protein
MQTLPNRRNLFPPAFCLSSDLGGEGRPDGLPVADRQPRTHAARAAGREAGRDVIGLGRISKLRLSS